MEPLLASEVNLDNIISSYRMYLGVTDDTSDQKKKIQAQECKYVLCCELFQPIDFCQSVNFPIAKLYSV